MKFRPINDQILIRRDATPDKTAGGILIPQNAQETAHRGEVLRVGAGRVGPSGAVIPLDVKVGDRILFGKYSGTEMKIDGEDYLLLKESEVLGVIE